MSTNGLESQGVCLKVGDGASPETFNLVGEVVDFDGPGGSASVIDFTHLRSTAREKKMGLPDEGQFSFNANLDPSDTTGQVRMRLLRKTRAEGNFKFELTDSPATVLSFSGYVLEFRISGGVDDKISVAMTIEITGDVVWS